MICQGHVYLLYQSVYNLINFKKSGQDLSEPQDFDTKGKKKKISAFQSTCTVPVPSCRGPMTSYSFLPPQLFILLMEEAGLMGSPCLVLPCLSSLKFIKPRVDAFLLQKTSRQQYLVQKEILVFDFMFLARKSTRNAKQCLAIQVQTSLRYVCSQEGIMCGKTTMQAFLVKFSSWYGAIRSK